MRSGTQLAFNLGVADFGGGTIKRGQWKGKDRVYVKGSMMYTDEAVGDTWRQKETTRKSVEKENDAWK